MCAALILIICGLANGGERRVRAQDSFGTLAALTSIQLPNNQMKKVGSQRITALKKLETLDLSQNLITGPIPTWFGQLTLSDYIQLGDNPFSGPIPGEICNIRGLKRMLIYDTQVTALPSTIANCATLTELVLFNNKIAGSLPVNLAKLKKLQRISLKQNKMTGTLPREIGDIATLTEFDIGNNKFTGSIPPNYGPFVEDELSTDFSGNMLKGTYRS